MSIKSLGEMIEEIQLLMEYAVPKEYRDEALELLEKHKGDLLAIHIFRSFYSTMPEGEDDAIKNLRLLTCNQGAFLICVETLLNAYLYIVSNEGAVFLGRYTDGIYEKEILDFFGINNWQAFAKNQGDILNIPLYEPVNQDHSICPVCSVAIGEYHTLGCPVEVCPWCDGQLTYCNCRFTQLGREELGDEADIEELLEKVEAAGRVPYEKGQGPSYPVCGDDEVILNE